MEYKKSMIILILAIFLLSITSVCASDANDTAIASEETIPIEIAQIDVNDTIIASDDTQAIEVAQGDESDEISVTDDSQEIEESNGEGTTVKEDIDLEIVVFDKVFPEAVECAVYSSVDGEYNLAIAGDLKTITVKDNLAYLEYGTLDDGTYEATVSFAGNENYNPAFKKTTFTVYPEGTQFFEIDVTPNKISYGETANVIHRLSDGATGVIMYYLHDGTFLGIYDVRDTLTLPVLDVGSWVVIANYSGDLNFHSSLDMAYITIAPDNTFFALNNKINGNDKTEINLTTDYYFNPTYDEEFANGIVINRPVTINGNGHTIDAKGKARVFNVQADDVTIENLTIKNANYNGDGGAVYFAKSGRAINCNLSFLKYSFLPVHSF